MKKPKATHKKKPNKKDIIEHADIAVALLYEDGKTPKVIAKGKDQSAKNIIKKGADAGVPLYAEPELAPVLAQIPLGDDIPESLYRAVAEVIAFAYIISGKTPDDLKNDIMG